MLSTQTTFECGELLLRRPLTSDAVRLSQATHDRTMLDRKWDDARELSVLQAQCWINSELESPPHNGAAHRHWLIVDKSSFNIVGALGIDWPISQYLTTELSYWLRESARRKGLATRSVQCATNWLIESSGAKGFLLRISDNNQDSIAVARRCGFVLERQCAGMSRYLLVAHKMRRPY
jgi:RimJ/RimL family protein N-acetyltransferase